MDSTKLFDPIRRQWVARTPEEEVRQGLIVYLLETLKVPMRLIGIEFSLSRLEQGNPRRVDVLVWKPATKGGGLMPWLLAECKAPGIRISQKQAWQVGNYLSTVRATWVMVTNGKSTVCLEQKPEGYCQAAGLPYFDS